MAIAEVDPEQVAEVVAGHDAGLVPIESTHPALRAESRRSISRHLGSSNSIIAGLSRVARSASPISCHFSFDSPSRVGFSSTFA
ncbi:MAG: hypothetical protein U5K30_04610 [Acidimicrobiales bacterium]|nr:hypothetical protein [Acidimicrobiales bacterium]